jgi:hypothetical protein
MTSSDVLKWLLGTAKFKDGTPSAKQDQALKERK